MQQGRYAPALKHLKRASELDAGFAETFLAIGNAYFGLNDSRSAVQAYTEALKRRPEYANALANRGAALVRLGRLEEAVLDFKSALAVSPGHQAARLNLEKTVSALEASQGEGKVLQ